MAEPARTSTGAPTVTETHPAWLARIHVTLKPVVLDPQGDAVLTGLHQLGFANVASVRVGKYLEVAFAAADQAAAEAAVTQMCARLLANPVIESYRFTVEAHAAP
ncbi:MAG TPA: phosphoribosylformylglycinamidine synthase subunit PurS [Ktedonobacterales bacterium]|jgi:phosphoribosylformylglycinamidine synthase